jgi:hypothetical protein
MKEPRPKYTQNELDVVLSLTRLQNEECLPQKRIQYRPNMYKIKEAHLHLLRYKMHIHVWHKKNCLTKIPYVK